MTLAQTLSVALVGVRGQLVEIEADVSGGALPGLSFTGLADTTVVEARDRIRAAMANSGISWPNLRITLALLPADVRKSGSCFDLGMAMALIAAAGQIPAEPLAGVVWLAELGLDGRLRPVRGVLPAVAAARDAGVRRVVVAEGNSAEAALVPGVDVRAARELSELVAWLRGEGSPPPMAEAAGGVEERLGPDLIDVAGQALAKRALEIAAAGAHHLYLLGVPGSGKTMLAERLAGLLPALDDAAALEVTAIHSVAGQLLPSAGLIRHAPFQAPHHTASLAALVGGGTGVARPGAISLAHHGVLFADEAPEFSAHALDALRQPLESGQIVLHRSAGPVTYPAAFQLVLAANPCPCAAKEGECVCAPQVRRRYLQRLSGPLLDRVDLHIRLHAVEHAALFETDDSRASSAEVAERVAVARAAARERWSGRWQVNAQVPGPALRKGRYALPRAVLAPAEAFLQRGELSVRGLDRIIRLAWTIADLSGLTVPDAAVMGEALFLRTGGTSAWAA